MTDETIAGRLAAVRAAVAAAAVAAGRPPDAVKLIAVSKTHPAAAVAEAVAAGQLTFGENRVQELEQKRPLLPATLEWHLIGHLQTNKVRPAVQGAALLHSIDSSRLLQRVAAIAGELGKRQAILLQANVSGELTKFGTSLEAMRPLLAEALALPTIECRGFMTMAPYEAPAADLHRLFAALRDFRDRLTGEFGVPLPELSMGMSGDYAIAIAEGATCVRIGTAIFGHRPAA
jgi:pyridoxal phosphate enzyme (YggS family)